MSGVSRSIQSPLRPSSCVGTNDEWFLRLVCSWSFRASIRTGSREGLFSYYLYDGLQLWTLAAEAGQSTSFAWGLLLAISALQFALALEALDDG